MALFDEQTGALDSAGIQLHELYSSYVRAGFTDEQAFELVKITITVAARG